MYNWVPEPNDGKDYVELSCKFEESDSVSYASMLHFCCIVVPVTNVEWFFCSLLFHFEIGKI